MTGDVLRYSHLGPLSAKVGTFLKQNGFGQGDVLVNVSHNGAKLHVFFVAVWRLGGIIQCIYPDEDPGRFFSKKFAYKLVSHLSLNVNI